MDSLNFDTCFYRSIEKGLSIETWCCGSRQIEGYLCFHPKVLDNNVTPQKCSKCTFYKIKKINNLEQNGESETNHQ